MTNPQQPPTYGLDAAAFGATGILLYQLLGVAIAEPGMIVERGRIQGRGGGSMPVKAWQLAAVTKVLTDYGIDVHVSVAKPDGPLHEAPAIVLPERAGEPLTPGGTPE